MPGKKKSKTWANIKDWYERHSSNRSWLVVWVAVPLIAAIVFNVVCLLNPTNGREFGFFYIAGYSLLGVSAYWGILSCTGYFLARKGNPRKRGFYAAVCIAVVLSATCVAVGQIENIRTRQSIFVDKYHSYDQATQMIELKKFMNATMDRNATIDPSVTDNILQSYNITLMLSEDPHVHGFAGLIYGALSVGVMCAGWRSKPKELDGNPAQNKKKREREIELAKVIVNFNIVLSIIFAVIILAAGDPFLMSSLRYIFVMLSAILAVLLFTLGFLVSSKNKADSTSFPAFLMALVISFTMGFVVGNMVFPVTKVPLGTYYSAKVPLGRTLYGVYPGQFVFMCASMLTIALLSLSLRHRQR